MSVGSRLRPVGEKARALILVGTAAVSAAIVLFLPPIHQDTAYHRFADTRDVLGLALAVTMSAPLPKTRFGVFRM